MGLLYKHPLLIAFAIWISWTSPSLAGQTLVLASREGALTNRFAELVLSKAYAQLDINIEFVPYPGARSIIEANVGRADGEVARLDFVLKQYTNLRKVPVPLFHSELSAFSNDRYKIDISDWQSLEGYSLTTVRGFKFVEKKLMDKSPRIVRTTAEAIQLIENDLVEVAVLNRFLGRLAIAEIDTKHVKVLNPPLERLPVFHLLHNKHELLIPKLTAVLENMERNGIIRSMWEGFTSREILKTSNQPGQVEPDVYILNTSTSPPYATPERTGFQDLVVTEVFRRIGLKGRVESYNESARALINANGNIDQGVAMRIKGLEKKYPNLVRVEERLIGNDFVAYSKNLELITDSWKSLEPYIAAYIHGWVIFERNLGPDQVKHAVKNTSQMFTMLDKGRVDLVLYERWQGLQQVRDTGINVKVHEPPLASVDMFMYVHKNYAHLAPKMAQALRSMKADGTYKEIIDSTLTALLP